MYVAHWHWSRDVVLLGSAPMFHVAAAAVIPPVLLVGGTIVMMPKFDPAGYAELIERHRITKSEEHTSELQSLMRISYAVFCLKKKNKYRRENRHKHTHTNTPDSNTND